MNIKVDFSLPTERVVRTLNQIIEWREHQRRSGLITARNISVAV
jgi:hypothetical protein